MTRSLTPSDISVLARAKQIRAKLRKASKRARPARVEKVGQAPRVRDNVHLKLIRQLPCLATLIRTGQEAYGVDACHVRANYPDAGWGGNPGLSSKPSDWRTLPLSRAEHTFQHGMNEKAYWADLGIYPPILCAVLREIDTADAMLGALRLHVRFARMGDVAI